MDDALSTDALQFGVEGFGCLIGGVSSTPRRGRQPDAGAVVLTAPLPGRLLAGHGFPIRRAANTGARQESSQLWSPPASRPRTGPSVRARLRPRWGQAAAGAVRTRRGCVLRQRRTSSIYQYQRAGMARLQIPCDEMWEWRHSRKLIFSDARKCAPGPQGRPNRPSSIILLVVGRRRRPIDGLSMVRRTPT
jgi:hypothetical protein